MIGTEIGTLTRMSEAIETRAGDSRYLKLAVPCKILAIVMSVGLPLVLRPRWGLSAVADVQLIGLGVLALVPNRWLVYGRISFAVFLLLSLFPFRIFLELDAYKNFGAVSAFGMLVALVVFGPLPVSLVLSRMRLLGGKKFMLA